MPLSDLIEAMRQHLDRHHPPGDTVALLYACVETVQQWHPQPSVEAAFALAVSIARAQGRADLTQGG